MPTKALVPKKQFLAGAPANRPPLLINVDETAWVRHTSGLAGTVLTRKRGSAKGTLGEARRRCANGAATSIWQVSPSSTGSHRQRAPVSRCNDGGPHHSFIARHHACLEVQVCVE